MATDLDVTTAAWGSENVEPESDTIANAAYRTQVARNTGVNYYFPKLVLQDTCSRNACSMIWFKLLMLWLRMKAVGLSLMNWDIIWDQCILLIVSGMLVIMKV